MAVAGEVGVAEVGRAPSAAAAGDVEDLDLLGGAPGLLCATPSVSMTMQNGQAVETTSGSGPSASSVRSR